ncbi:MAG: F0F1 ATP synthase subunit gamma [Gammaproteobacteria bacterium]|nr:F0F1 ATP synthase subunit gamma [Gammaproteobacteria bacterium]MDH3846444.1 F0F1 ATP synthase subunit gamma [Gammaproteobacteria bacterium]MDH3863967.1 F0F1 ATP synthase subunit gamma [Gammaproteobacteria bacterium]MDH3905852.1 F0F1 ATP synthase subunit gamma [Gammaproteobacteria bacterium]MDH4003831.1 F0F1 ATP synthase subunit gamma [Gammaproteobacteria bacterium]
MAGEKEIRSKIASVKNMQKITSAMEKVAASKIRKAQKQMEESRPYAQRIRRVIGHLSYANPDYRHPFLIERDAKRVGLIVISTDRGLCGGLNANLFKTVIGEIAKWRGEGVEVDLALVGAKAVQFFRRMGGNVVGTATHLGDRPSVNDLIGAITIMLNAYEKGTIDRLFLLHNEFISAMNQNPEVTTLLPVSQIDIGDESLQEHWDYIYEPDAGELLDDVLTRYIESQVYRGAVENFACEMAAKMVAMKSATDNAGEIIDGLQLEYNKARQAAITQEISEIVGGAAAVSG